MWRAVCARGGLARHKNRWRNILARPPLASSWHDYASWFVLRHEIEHVPQRHGQKAEVIDSELEGENASPDANLPEEEGIANAAVQDFCLPVADMESFYIRKAPYFYERDVVGFARRVQRHPGIVVGQIQRRDRAVEFSPVLSGQDSRIHRIERRCRWMEATAPVRL